MKIFITHFLFNSSFEIKIYDIYYLYRRKCVFLLHFTVLFHHSTVLDSTLDIKKRNDKINSS